MPVTLQRKDTVVRRSTPSNRSNPTNDRGIVLPMALIMLVIISFAGLLAARNSATFEQFSNNMRTNQVARVAAEDALRYCERVAIDSVDGGTNFATDVGKIVTTAISADDVSTISGGAWNTKSNWAPGAANLVTVTPTYGGDVQLTTGQRANSPTCIIQAMVNDRFLITSRGLSSDASVVASGATAGTLSAGSEVWLQSILTPTVPVLSANNGVE
jgi:type IV pilus assembly protein PilX